MGSEQAGAVREASQTSDITRVRAVYGGTGDFGIHVVRENGLPDVALTVFANDLRRILSDGSVRGYLRETLAFVNWCASDPVTRTRGWYWEAEPSQVRHAVRQYLTVAAECRITIRPDTLGLRASYINATVGTRINVSLLLVALKKLYDVVTDHGFYLFANPMVHEAARQTMGELRRQRREAMRAVTGRAPMPAISGVDAPTDFRLTGEWMSPQTRIVIRIVIDPLMSCDHLRARDRPESAPSLPEPFGHARSLRRALQV